MNTFGTIYRLTSFGESHGPATGGIIDGLPAGIRFSLNEIQQALDRRRPGSGATVSPRDEKDRLHILSGLMAVNENGELSGLSTETDTAVSLGTPIGFYVENSDALPGAYDHLRGLYRPNHADYTYEKKYGLRDWRGGGRSSGRETVSRVVAGAFATQFLRDKGISIHAEISEIGGISDSTRFQEVIGEARRQGDSLGGIVSAVLSGVPAGWGEPVFGKLQQMLASAMLSIGGVHGFEYGDGFSLAQMTGSHAADIMTPQGFRTNHCGGILGGISSGTEIVFRVAFKPTPSISRPLQTVDRTGNAVSLSTNGRHDPCIAVRGCEVVKAMSAMVLMDACLLNLSARECDGTLL